MDAPIQITGHQLEVTPALKQFTEDKLSKLNRRSDINHIHVTLEVKKRRQKAQATLSVSGTALFAKAESDDLYAAIDLLVDKLDRQIIKHKEKHDNHRST